MREKVAGAIKNLPPNTLPPVIQKSDPDSDSILSMIVGSDKSLRETTEIADKQIKRVLETVDGVGAVTLTGSRPRQIRLFADAEKMNAYGITINQFQQAIQRENVEVPGGSIVRGTNEFAVRTLGRVDAVSQFGDIIVANTNGSPIRVNDIGRVEDSFAEPTNWNVLNDRESVRLDVRRQSGTNTVEVVDDVKEKLEQIKKTLPPGVELKILSDQSVFINASVAALKEHLLVRQPSREPHRSALHEKFPARADRIAGDSDLDHRDIHADQGDEFHAEQHDIAGAHAGGGHRHR